VFVLQQAALLDCMRVYVRHSIRTRREGIQFSNSVSGSVVRAAAATRESRLLGAAAAAALLDPASRASMAEGMLRGGVGLRSGRKERENSGPRSELVRDAPST
jgi:predicted oxidoreductase